MRANNIYAIFSARAQKFFTFFCVKKIADILGLCNILHLFHVWPLFNYFIDTMSAQHYLKSLSNCYKNPSIRINTLSGISNSEPNNVPIRVAPKFRSSKSKKRTNNYVSPLFDSRGHPDEETDWESMLPEVKAGKLIRKRKHTVPPIDNIDPNFGVSYNEAKHGDILRSELDISHLTPSQQITLTDF